MRIKNFLQFTNEAISGTELVGPVGPAYGETRLQNKTVNKTHTSMVSTTAKNQNSKNGLTNDFFFEDEYEELRVNYLKSGGRLTDLTGDSTSDIEIMCNFLERR